MNRQHWGGLVLTWEGLDRLPGLADAVDDGTEPDLVLSAGEVSLPSPVDGEQVAVTLRGVPGRWLRTMPGVGRALVTDRRVVVDCFTEPPPPDLATQLESAVLPLAAMQRGRLPLSATAVVRDGAALLLVGPPASGKTSVAAELVGQGWAVAGDGVCVVDVDATGAAVVLPTSRMLRRWQYDLGEESGDHPADLATGWRRRWLGAPGSSGPTPIRTIALLDPVGSEVQSLRGGDRVAALFTAGNAFAGATARLLPPARRFLLDTALARAEVVVLPSGGGSGLAAERLTSLLSASCRAPPRPHRPPRTAPSLPGGAGIVWLASYPKSGNTWVRCWLDRLLHPDRELDLNQLEATQGILSDRVRIDRSLGLPSADLAPEALESLFPVVVRSWAVGDAERTLIKVHDALGLGADGALRLPAAAAILVVRNPLDIAASFAHHQGVPIDRAVNDLCDPGMVMARAGGRLNNQVPQPLGTWAQHTASWLAAPFPVHVARYEDLLAGPVAFAAIATALGLSPSAEELAQAVDSSSFTRMQRCERERGFREKPSADRSFFRAGRSEGWRSELSRGQRERIVAVNGEMMRRLGYLPQAGT